MCIDWLLVIVNRSLSFNIFHFELEICDAIITAGFCDRPL